MNSIKSTQNKVENLEYVEPEIWKDVKGYEGLYGVSNKGRLRSYYNNRWGLTKSPKELPSIKDRKIIKQYIEKKGGYKCAALYSNGDQSTHRIHTLVAKAFIPNPENKPQVNHIDGDKTNNHVSNLEWCTYSENLKHSYEIGLRSMKGENHSKAIVTEVEVLEIRAFGSRGWFTQEEIGEAYGLSPQAVSGILCRRNWKHI